MRNLLHAAGVKSVHDGLRHSYASYRCRHVRNELPKLAEEMGNSPTEILKSYKATVTDAEGGRLVWYEDRRSIMLTGSGELKSLAQTV